MKLINVLLLVFLLSAFAIGISLENIDIGEINQKIDNASSISSNFTLESNSSNTYVNSGFKILESFMKFALTAALETMRVGILFGHENPEYFTSEFIIGIVKLIIWAVIIGALAVPIMYCVAFIILALIWIKNFFTKN